MKNKIYYVATTAAVLLWSASFIATKIAYTMFTPVMVGFTRAVLAAMILEAVRLLTRSKERPAGKDLRTIAVSGLLGITLYFTAENMGVQLTTASNASLIVASFPAITALFEFLIFRIKPDLKKVTGILIAFGGVGILTMTQSSALDKETLYGNLLLITAGIVWAFYNFTARSVTAKYSPLTISFYQMLFGAIFFIPVVLLEQGEVQTVTVPGIAALVYLSCGCSVAAFLLYNFGLRKLSAATSTSLMNLVPVFGLVFSASLLHEPISLRQTAGGIVVIIGVILSTGKTKTAQKGS